MPVDWREGPLLEGGLIPTDPASFVTVGTQSWHPLLRGGFGTESTCGLEGEVVKVTSLADSGPGTLREALLAEGPRVVVFEVSGVIALESQLTVNSPYLTIAGQTAPPPGIGIYHEQFRIEETHDVCIQHVRFRIGDQHADGTPVTSQEAGNRDGVVVAASDHIVFDNVSMSWGLDEILTTRLGVSDFTLRDSIVAEGLHESVHETPAHSYCFLADDTTRAAVVGNLFAHCNRRSPRADGGAWVIANNFIYNPGDFAIHGHDPARYTVVGNVLSFPSDPAALEDGGPPALVVSRSPDIFAFFVGNAIPADRELYGVQGDGSTLDEAAGVEVWQGDVHPLEPEAVEPTLLPHVGAFPAFRDAADARVVADTQAREGVYLDSQDEVGGYPPLEENTRPLSPPQDPAGDDDCDGIPNLIDWLQGFTDEVES